MYQAVVTPRTNNNFVRNAGTYRSPLFETETEAYAEAIAAAEKCGIPVSLEVQKVDM